MSQKLSVNNFKWVEDTSRINEEFLKNYNENSNKGYIFEVDVNVDVEPFLQRRMKIDKLKT